MMIDKLTLKEIYDLYGDKEVWIAHFDSDISDHTKTNFLKPIQVKVEKEKKYLFFNNYFVKDKPNIRNDKRYIISEYGYDVRTAYYEEIEIWYYHITKNKLDSFRTELNKKIDEFINIKIGV